MRLSHIVSSLLLVGGLSVAGCSSDEAVTISGDELNQYVDTHADEIAEDERIEAEEEAEEEEEEDED